MKVLVQGSAGTRALDIALAPGPDWGTSVHLTVPRWGSKPISFTRIPGFGPRKTCFASSLFAVCSSISMCRRVHNLLRRLWGVPLSDERDMSTAGFLLGRFLSCAAVHLQFEQCPIPGLSGLSRVGVIYPFTLQHLFLSIWNDTVWKHLHFRDQFARETMIFHIAVHLVSGYSCWRPHCEITILVEFLDSICSNCNKLGNSCQLNYIESSLVYPSGFVDPF